MEKIEDGYYWAGFLCIPGSDMEPVEVQGSSARRSGDHEWWDCDDFRFGPRIEPPKEG